MGALAASFLVQYGPAPLRLVYWLLAGGFVAGIAFVAVLSEPGQHRPGALASLRPQAGVPRPAWRAFAAGTPALIAGWALYRGSAAALGRRGAGRPGDLPAITFAGGRTAASSAASTVASTGASTGPSMGAGERRASGRAGQQADEALAQGPWSVPLCVEGAADAGGDSERAAAPR